MLFPIPAYTQYADINAQCDGKGQKAIGTGAPLPCSSEYWGNNWIMCVNGLCNGAVHKILSNNSKILH